MIKITGKGFQEFQDYIKRIYPRGTRITAMRAIAEYLIGNERHGLKHEPAQKVVSRAEAYGKVSDAPPGYFSWAQFRYVAKMTNGFKENIPYDRTHELANAWEQRETDDWRRVALLNETPGSEWVVGDKQARQPALVGWRKWRDVVASNYKGAIRAAQQSVNRLLKEKRK